VVWRCRRRDGGTEDRAFERRRPRKLARCCPQSLSEVVRCLDDASTSFLENAATNEICARIHEVLLQARLHSNAPEWATLRAAVREHRIAEFLYQDPLTRRAFEKPRGYAGDADLIDLVYGATPAQVLLEPATDVGRLIYNYNFSTPACEAVRNRAQTISNKVDELSQERAGMSVLSVACGLLRELAGSISLQKGRVRRCVGLDHDAKTIEDITPPSDHVDFEAAVASARDLVVGNYKLRETFDFIYSAGLFDYLPDAAFVQLVKTLWTHCSPGGTLLIANVTPDNPQLGYLESFMDWMFVLREPSDLERLAQTATGPDATISCFSETNGIICFAEIVKRR
jgi:2-polyprenyl-3-methyl-5-hydroxy-6-metoxy-1,4-benzoquinol methylase